MDTKYVPKTAKLMMTLVPVAKAGNLNFRKFTILLSAVATAPCADTSDFRLGTFGSIDLLLLGWLDPEAACASKPGFSADAAMSSGPRVAVSLAGKLLTRFCRKGGRLPYIFLS